MGNSLETYLHDHLAGAVHAIETLKTMRDRQNNTPLGDFAAKLLVEVEADRETLRQLTERIGSGSNTMKEMATWLAERASRLKLTHESNHSLPWAPSRLWNSSRSAFMASGRSGVLSMSPPQRIRD